jgi:hypothetical protein
MKINGIGVLLALLACAQGCKEVINSGSDSLADPAVMPRVTYTLPLANSIGPYEETYGTEYGTYAIQIRFNKLMQRASLANAVTARSSAGRSVRANVPTSPGVVSSLSVSFYDSLTGKNLLYDPKIAETLTLKIDTNAVDINGNHLTYVWSGTYMPEPYFRVKAVYPPNGTDNFDASGQVSLEFNAAVDTHIFANTSVLPHAGGTWRLQSYDSMSIDYTQGALDPDQEYAITVSAGARDVLGNPLHEAFTSRLSTGRFRVHYIDVTPPGYRIPLYASIRVACSARLDPATIAAAFHLLPAVTGSLVLDPDNPSAFSFVPSAEFQPSTNYSIVVDTLLKSASGKSLFYASARQFSTDQFRVSYVAPPNGGTDVSPYTILYFSFTGAVDTSTIQSGIRFDPTISGAFDLSESHTGIVRFLPYEALLRTRSYTVRISTNVKSVGGISLADSLTTAFTTGW